MVCSSELSQRRSSVGDELVLVERFIFLRLGRALIGVAGLDRWPFLIENREVVGEKWFNPYLVRVCDAPYLN